MLDGLVAEAAEELNLDTEQGVTALELFFDLVFVFAITQVTRFLYHDPTWLGLLRAIAILMALWIAWSGFAWLGNTAGTDEGTARVVLLGVMGPLLIASLAVPNAFGREALLFGVAFFVVRAMHLLAYRVLARGRPKLGLVVAQLARSELPAAALLILAGVVSGNARAACWAGAIAVDYLPLMLGDTSNWRIRPAHFAERHRLIIIIALGESSAARTLGAAILDTGTVVAALLGITVAAALWWTYFDVVATVAERKLRAAVAAVQARMAAESFTFLHLPMVAGIVIFGFGVKVTLRDVSAHLAGVPATALTCGVALYFLALSLLKRRNIGSYNWPRLTAAATLVVLAPAATHIPALLALGLVALVSCCLVAYEFWRYAEARDRIRHGS